MCQLSGDRSKVGTSEGDRNQVRKTEEDSTDDDSREINEKDTVESDQCILIKSRLKAVDVGKEGLEDEQEYVDKCFEQVVQHDESSRDRREARDLRRGMVYMR